MKSTENIQEDYRNGLSKTVHSIRKLQATIIHANHVPTSVLVSSNCKLQIFISFRKLQKALLITRSQLGRSLQNVMTINFRDLFFSFPR